MYLVAPSSLEMHVHRCGDREVSAGLNFVVIGAVDTPGYKAKWGDLVSFLDDEECSNSAGDDGLLYLGGQGGEPSHDWLNSICYFDMRVAP
jgi:hypothetical protein